MDVLRYFLICLLLGWLLTGCHFTYFVKGGYHQAKILSRQESVTAVLANPNTKGEVRRKLELAMDVMSFAERELGLKTKGNYKNFVQLDDKYVTYAVTAADKYKLQAYLWDFPIVGSVPYKGFFVKQDADEEASELSKKGYDVLVRGVSAYSSLGWIKDPILSSMLNYRDEDFVNLLIHETIHANLYIKSAADFNEQLATFLGNKGSELYFKSNAILKTTAIDYTRKSNHDEKLFSKFLSEELKQLEKFYAENKDLNEEKKKQRLKEIQERFKKQVAPKLLSGSYSRFSEEELNNAVLISYKTYLMDLSDFEFVFEKYKKDFSTFLEACKTLEKSEDPQKAFRNL